MAIELKQSLKLSQQLVITPQLQQAIKLLQLSRIELSDMIQDELLENPMLEEGPQEEDEEVPTEVAKEIEVEGELDKSHEAQAEVGTKDGELPEPKEFDWENYMGTYNAPGEDLRSFANSDELPNYENITPKPTTLHDHLDWQLKMANLAEWEEEIALTILGVLDDNGYLTSSLEEIAEKNSYKLENVKDVLEYVQELDPLGVGARDL